MIEYVYIAGPYTYPDPAINVAEAINAADELARGGLTPFIPHLTHFWHLLFPHEKDFWYEYDLQWVRKTDALLRLPGYSAGADREVFEAMQLGLPIFRSVEDVLRAAHLHKQPP